jgi:hypothetical protein
LESLAYNFNWRPHAGEDEITDKTCQFEFYDEHNCKGQVISVLEEVSSIRRRILSRSLDSR